MEQWDAFCARFPSSESVATEGAGAFVSAAAHFGVDGARALGYCLSLRVSSHLLARIFAALPASPPHLADSVASAILEGAAETLVLEAAEALIPEEIEATAVVGGATLDRLSPGTPACVAALDPSRGVLSPEELGATPDDLCRAALASEDGMRSILSGLVPRLLDGDTEAVTALQKIAADARGVPARKVAEMLEIRKGISILL